MVINFINNKRLSYIRALFDDIGINIEPLKSDSFIFELKCNLMGCYF